MMIIIKDCSKSSIKAFSLLELSIVLIVIAFITSTILKASEYIETNKRINSIVEKLAYFSTAAYNFKDKFGTWPGDYNSFSVAGNSNGIIDVPGLNTGTERISAFLQMSEAGFIEGSFSAVWDSNTNFAPKADIPNSYYFFGSHLLTNVIGMDNTIQVLTLAGFNVAGVVSLDSEIPVLSAREALLIDEKIDDGKPNLGAIRANPGITSFSCYNSGVDTYQVGELGANCALYLLLTN